MNDAELIDAVAKVIMWPGEVMTWQSSPGQWRCLSDRFYNEKTFQPLKNANHWMMVIEKMREAKYEIKINFLRTGGNEVELWKFQGHAYYACNDNIGHAVCLAALAAVRRDK